MAQSITVPLLDLKAQYATIRDEIRPAGAAKCPACDAEYRLENGQVREASNA